MTVSNRSLTFGKQTVIQTTAALSDKDRTFISESLKQTRNMILPYTASHLEPTMQGVGVYKVSGQINQLCIPDEIGEFLSSLFGPPQSSVLQGNGIYKHIFIPDTTKRFYTLAINKDDVTRLYKGLFVTGMNLKVAPGEPVLLTWDCVARADEVGVYDSSPSFESVLNSLTFIHLAVALGTTDPKEVRALDLKTGYAADTDFTMLGSQFLQDQIKKEWTTEVTTDLKFDTNAELQRFYNGVPAGGSVIGSSPADSVTENALVFTFTGALVGGANYYKMVITLPKTVMDTEDSNIDKRETVVRNVMFKPRYDSTYGIMIELYNAISSYA